jgi:hypothetical protein
MHAHKRSPNVVGEPEEAPEVDEVTEYQLQSDHDAASIAPEDLDRFLETQFGQSMTSDNGMPSADWLRTKLKTKSAVIRYLHYKGFKVKDISKHLGLRYQHVRNVLTTELKRGPNEPFKIDGEDYIAPSLTSDSE